MVGKPMRVRAEFRVKSATGSRSYFKYRVTLPARSEDRAACEPSRELHPNTIKEASWSEPQLWRFTVRIKNKGRSNIGDCSTGLAELNSLRANDFG
jgi:hypothetical protein